MSIPTISSFVLYKEEFLKNLKLNDYKEFFLEKKVDVKNLFIYNAYYRINSFILLNLMENLTEKDFIKIVKENKLINNFDKSNKLTCHYILYCIENENLYFNYITVNCKTFNIDELKYMRQIKLNKLNDFR